MTTAGRKISVVICTRDRPETIGQAVESVADCDYAPFDVHVMDQSATTLTRDVVRALGARHAAGGRVHYHHLERAGLSRAYNAGLRVSDGEIIACTDDDVVVPRDWLTRIARAFEADPHAGLLFGQVLVPPSLEEACRRGMIVPGVTFERRERLTGGGRFKPLGMGANMAIRRSVLEALGGFDEALGGGGPLRSSQDHDLAFRAYRQGTTILIEPEIRVDHYGTRTPEQWSQTLASYGIGDGAFYAKHMRCGDRLALWLFLEVFLRAHARWLRRLWRERRWLAEPYASHLLPGVRRARRFAIDRERRLFTVPVTGGTIVTDANAVTTSVRGPDREHA